MESLETSETVLRASRLEGGSVVTDLGYGILINASSTLKREWIVLNDPQCPIQLRMAGINTIYRDEQYRFSQSGELFGSEGVMAFEIRYVLYDVFGRHIKTLSALSVFDLNSGRTANLQALGEWVAWENEVASFLTSVAFVAAVRTLGTGVWHQKEQLVTHQLARIELASNSGVLEPSK